MGSNDFVDLGGESGDDVLRNVPYNIVVDSHVVVNQFVAHAGHFAPGRCAASMVYRTYTYWTSLRIVLPM